MKIFAQFVSSFISGILIGIVGLIIGAYIGGNFGFFEFGGNTGYESGGAFFAIVGISLGSLLGIMLAKKLQKEQHRYGMAFIVTIATSCIGLIFFDYHMSIAIEMSILLTPPVTITAITNWRKL